MRFFLSLLAVMFLLSACASSQLRYARINSELLYSLPQNPWNGPQQSAHQQVTLTFADKTILLQALVQLSDRDVRILLLDPAGRRALELQWRVDSLVVHKADWLPGNVEGEDILARLVWAFWPVEVAQQGLPETAQITETVDGRVISHNGKRIIVISKDNPNPWLGTTVVSQEGSSFNLTITSSLKSVK